MSVAKTLVTDSANNSASTETIRTVAQRRELGTLREDIVFMEWFLVWGCCPDGSATLT